MITTPSSFTHEHLSTLKFKELQKLSVQFHVNKRWAKKQELIENLLALKEKNEETTDNKQEDEEWRDANSVFSDLKLKNENEGNKRLTYNVTSKSSTGHNDPHLTFEVPQNGKNLLCEMVNSRETYDIPPSKADFELLKESRATFEIPPQKKLTDEIDPRATFDVCKNGETLLKKNMSVNKNFNEGSSTKKNIKNSEICVKNVHSFEFKPEAEKSQKFKRNLKNGKQKKDDRRKPEIKLLTIPYARITRRTRAGEASKNDSSPIKMSKKSINIKKSTRLPPNKADLIKSPFSSVKKSVNKETIIQSLTKTQPGKIIQSKVPIRLKVTEEKSKPVDNSNEENIKNVLRSQVSKAGDEVVNKKLNAIKVNFRTPPPSVLKSSKVVALKKTPLRKDVEGHTPGDKPITKSITATKMPDFSKIHKRQFEQMDSLHDYLKKKEERVRKLFGTPQPGQQLHNLNKSASVFHFHSTEKENKGSENLKNVTTTPLKKKENDSNFIQKEALKSKLSLTKLRTDIKDKNRSHIHGVRTNKRFELQMKFRNM